MSTATLPASIANLVNPTKYLSCAETAKLIRQALKEAFPEVKFSVRSSNYAGGASISVRWSSGPTNRQVEPIAKTFQGASFDGSIDLQSSHHHALNGQPVHFGADYVNCGRDDDREKVTALAGILERAKPADWYHLARKAGLSADDANGALRYRPNARELAASILRHMPQPQFDGRRSKTAEQVAFLR